ETCALRERLGPPGLRVLRPALHLLDEEDIEVAVAVHVREDGARAHRGDELRVEDVAVEVELDAALLGDVPKERPADAATRGVRAAEEDLRRDGPRHEERADDDAEGLQHAAKLHLLKERTAERRPSRSL